jgi:Major Facilitator Superfamily
VPTRSSAAPSDRTPDDVITRPVGPSRFLWIVLPYAVYIGFTTNGGASLLLRRAGLSVGEVANAVALLGIPATLYFLWSPLADLWLPRRTWYALSTSLAGIALALGCWVLERDPKLSIWIFFIGMLFCMLISSAYGGLMASLVAPEQRTRASAWAQASNLGGGAIGPGMLLYVALHITSSAWVLITLVLMMLPLVALIGLQEPVRAPTPGFRLHLREIGHELRATCLLPRNFFGLLLLLAPPGAGALIGLLPAISPDYHVSGTSVVWINGIGGGALMAVGCLVGGWVPRFDRRIAYALAGALNALPAAFLVFAPPTATTYIIGTIAYLFTIGLTSTLSMDLVLDMVGVAGRSGSLRYSILSALSYVPIAYMTWLEGRAADAFGFKGVPAIEALSALFDLPLILIWIWWARRSRTRSGTPMSASA